MVVHSCKGSTVETEGREFQVEDQAELHGQILPHTITKALQAHAYEYKV